MIENIAPTQQQSVKSTFNKSCCNCRLTGSRRQVHVVNRFPSFTTKRSAVKKVHSLATDVKKPPQTSEPASVSSPVPNTSRLPRHRRMLGDSLDEGDGMAGMAISLLPPPPTVINISDSKEAAIAMPHIDHQTLGLVKDRALSGSKPGARSDSFKLGLVVEGGGMRGCVSGGALQALADLGLRECFDSVYGASAGALNATYFLSGQRDGVDIYHDYIANEKFIDLKRLSIWSKDSTSPALDLSFLIDHVMEKEHPLDWDAVLNSPIPLKVVASSLDKLRSVVLEAFTDKQDLITCLKASANVPEVAGRPIEHRGQLLVDAAVFEPVPFRSAIADGCTHVLVLCNRSKPTKKSFFDTHMELAMATVVKRAIMSPSYMTEAWKAEFDSMAMGDGISEEVMLAKALESQDAHNQYAWFAGAHVFPLYPHAKPTNFSPVCTDVPTLKAGVQEGRRMVMQLMEVLLMGGGGQSHVGSSGNGNNIVPLKMEWS